MCIYIYIFVSNVCDDHAFWDTNVDWYDGRDEIVQNKSWPNFHQLNKFCGTYVDLGVRESCGKTNACVFLIDKATPTNYEPSYTSLEFRSTVQACTICDTPFNIAPAREISTLLSFQY